MEIRGTTILDMRVVDALCERLGLTPGGPYLTELVTFSGAWCRLGLPSDSDSVDTATATGLVLASPGTIPQTSEPDDSDDRNFTESGDWVDELDPAASLVMAPLEAPAFEQSSCIVIRDVLAGDDEIAIALLDDLVQRSVEAGFSSIVWLENDSTQWWADLLHEQLLPHWGGAMGTGCSELGDLGEVGFWVSFG